MNPIAKYFLLASIALLHAGCAYTLQDAHDEIAANAPRMPVAELMPGTAPGEARVIVLKGTDSLFNNAPLLDDHWLQGKMTEAEYVQAISSINEAVAQSMVGEIDLPSEAPERDQRRAQAAAVRVAVLDAAWQKRGVHFTFHAGETHQTLIERRAVAFSMDTFVYVRLD